MMGSHASPWCRTERPGGAEARCCIITGVPKSEGDHLLKRLPPWIVAIFILEIVGIVIFVARS